MNVVLGIGCDRGVSLQTLEDAMTEALAQAGLETNTVTALATIDKKNDESAILNLADKHGWAVEFYPAEKLAQVPVPNPSDTVLKYMGTPAVAEAAAMLYAKTTVDDLLVEKLKFLGKDGKNATISVVRLSA